MLAGGGVQLGLDLADADPAVGQVIESLAGGSSNLRGPGPWRIQGHPFKSHVHRSDQGFPGERTGDDIVDGADLTLLLGNWGPC